MDIEKTDDTVVDQTTESMDVTPDTQDVQVDDVQITEPDEKRNFFSSVYHSMFGSKKDKVESSAEGNADAVVETSPAAKDDSMEVDIEQSVYDSAKKVGFTDEQIARMYADNKEALVKLVTPVRIDQEEQVEQKAAAPEVKSLEKLTVTVEDMAQLKEQYGDEVMDKIVSPLLAKLNQTIDIVNQQSAQSTEVASKLNKQAVSEQVQAFQASMDKLGETYDVFGKWENVPRTNGKVDVGSPVVVAREEVWKMARKLQVNGQDWPTAVDDAVAWYKGKNLEKTAEAALVKKLQSRKIQFSPRPASRKVAPEKLQGDAAKSAVIKEGLKAIGKEV